MFIPHSYSLALALMLLSMFSWGSWANTQKAARGWRFELFYWDYVWGILICALAIGLTLGRSQPGDTDSFFNNFGSASAGNYALAFMGGVVFNVANMLLVAAIAIAGMAVAFPIGIGLALVIGTFLNYLIAPNGNPLLLFGGVGLVVIAIILDALAYRGLAGSGSASRKGILLSLLCGIGMGLFYPFVAEALASDRHLVPYTVAVVFAFGVLVSNLPVNYAWMRRPVSGSPLALTDYFSGTSLLHFWGIAGGIVWGVGTISNFVASYARMVGPAASYALGQGATMISALWGVFIWKEFRGAGPRVKRLLVLMFAFFIAGLAAIALAPVIR